MSMFLGEKQETDTRQPSIPRRGTEEYLSPEERDFIQRYLSHPDDFPPAFKSWILDHIAVNIPQIPFSQISGAPLSKALEIISSSTLTSEGTFSFANISQDFVHLQVILTARGSVASGVVTVLMRLNGDSAANYGWMVNSSAGNTSNLSDTSLYVGDIVADSALPLLTRAGQVYVEIPYYRTGAFTKQTLSRFSRMGTGQGSIGIGGGSWNSTTAITSLSIFPSVGNFKVDSRCDLLGLRQPN